MKISDWPSQQKIRSNPDDKKQALETLFRRNISKTDYAPPYFNQNLVKSL